MKGEEKCENFVRNGGVIMCLSHLMGSQKRPSELNFCLVQCDMQMLIHFFIIFNSIHHHNYTINLVIDYA